MESERQPIALVAQFQVAPNRRLDLFSLTIFASKIGYNRRPYITRNEYDVDLSKKWGYLFYKSGFSGGRTVEVSGVYFVYGDIKITEGPTQLVWGGDSEPWTAPETLAIRERNRTRRQKRLPRRFGGHGRNLLAWLRSNGIEQESVHCSECHDCMPSDELCDHCWWCEKKCWYSTPGDRCGCADRRICDGDEFEDVEANDG